MNILIVDDDQNTRELLSTILRARGYTVLSSETAVEALDNLTEYKPDLIVSDILMPGLDGFEFCRKVRSEPGLQHIPFVMFSGTFLDKKDRDFAQKLGVSYFLAKPIDPNRFTEAIEQILEDQDKSNHPTGEMVHRHTGESVSHTDLIADKLYQKVQELDREKAALDNKEEQLRILTGLLPDMMAEFDTSYRLVFANDPFLSGFGLTRDSALGKTLEDVLDNDVRNRLIQYIQRAMAGRSCAATFLLPDKINGNSRHILARCIPRIDNTGTVSSIVIVLSDITKLREIESTLHERETMLQSVLDSAPIILFALDRNGIITLSEGESLKLVGYEPGQNVGSCVLDVFAESDELLAHVQRALSGESFSETLTLHDRVLRVSFTAQTGTKGQFLGTVGVAVDITERDTLERELVKISDAERERIGQDLHDSLGQTLTGINLMSQALQRKLYKLGMEETKDARKIGGLAAYAIDITRQAIRGLSPVSRIESGLNIALEELVHNTQELHNIPFRLDLETEISLDSHESAVQVYRIVQEAINNAIKHANPELIEISYRDTGSVHSFTVRDHPRKRRRPTAGGTGMGLNIMRHRSNIIGATLAIDIREDGTQVTCTIPMNKPVHSVQPERKVSHVGNQDKTPNTVN